MAEIDNGHARPRRLDLQGNAWWPLDDPALCWLVEDGGLAVFGVALEDGLPVGKRRYLFSVGAGELLAGFPLRRVGAETGVIGVALAASRLTEIPAHALAQGGPLAHERPRLLRWIGQWQAALETAGAGAAAPPTAVPEQASVEELLGRHRGFLEGLERLEAQQREIDRTRMQRQREQSRVAAQRAVDELVAVFRADGAEGPTGAPLYVAAAAVGRAQGMRIVPPLAWEAGGGRADPLQAIARASQVRVRRVLLHDGWWRQDCGPLLGFRGAAGQPVALLPAGPGRYRLFDPATRSHEPLTEAAAGQLKPEAYFLYRPLPAEATSGVALIRFALRGRGRDLWLILATGIAATLLGMFTPQAVALLVDHAIPNADRGLLLELGLGLLAAAGGTALFRFSQGVALMRLQTAADAATQPAVWDRLLGLRLSFFRRYSTGDLQSRVTAVSQIRELLGGTTFRTLFGSVILLLNFGLLLYYSLLLALLAAGVALLSAAVTIVSGVLILRCVRQLLELRGRFFGFMVQLINGVAKLRVAAAEERAFGRWATEYARVVQLEARQGELQDLVRVLNVSLSGLGAVLLFALAAALVLPGPAGTGLSTGAFLAFFTAFGTFVGAVVSVSDTVVDVLAISILRERARPILEATPEVGENKADPGRLDGRLELKHVTFRYHQDGPVTLDDVSLRIEAGEFVALVGPSGSGKSTILRLLLGFETAQSGTILIDGQELGGIDVHAVRRQLGVVLQTGRINTGSIYDNIASSTPITLHDAWEAARATGFAGDIEAMPMGMHTVISEGGSNISGGQRQRLLLTRALVHKPKVLMLDEATSALDNETQAVVSRSLEQLEVTRIVVAHRLSTIRHAHRIYVIDAGRVVEQGPFDELARGDGLFSRLMARQLT